MPKQPPEPKPAFMDPKVESLLRHHELELWIPLLEAEAPDVVKDWDTFVDVGNTMGFKIKAIKAYKEEIKPKPHSRSLSGVKNLNRLRGNQSGLNYAEAFEIIREISK